MPLLGGETVGQAALDLATRPIARVNAEPLECAGRRNNDPAPPAFLHHKPGEMGEPVVLDRMRQQPAGQIGGRPRPEGTKPETVLQFGRMAPAILLRSQIADSGVGKNVDLRGDKTDESGRRPFVGAKGTAGVPQVAEHEGVTEAAVIAATAPDQRDVTGGSRVVAHQVSLIHRRIEQRGDLGFGQLLSSHHSCPPRP